MADRLPTIAPRAPGCYICALGSPKREDITLRQFEPDGTPKPDNGEAAMYLLALDLTWQPQVRGLRLGLHRKHVQAWIERGGDDTAVETTRAERIRPLEQADWVSTMKITGDLGFAAAQQLAERLERGELSEREMVSLARLGLASAQSQAKIAGRTLGRKFDHWMKLAAGMDPDNPWPDKE